jgi:dTDP-4-amino-4,6-dideoxygalactose transaminase
MAVKLAVDGGTPVRTKPWPAWPIWGSEEEDAVLDVLRSGQWWGIGGRYVPRFEEAFAASQDANHAVCVTNGTAALEVALRGLGIGCGDEVIVPPYTFIATASSVLAVSATPVFVDVEPHSFNIDPAAVEAAITPRTRAIIPVHIGGRPADMDGVLDVARRHGLIVIEDAAQAHAAEWRGRKVGALGDCGTFSFQASKNVNAGEGGAIVCDDETVYDKVWSVHNVGRTRSGKWYEHHVLGGNFRMTEWQAAIAMAQLGRLPQQTEIRTRNAERLTGLLSGIAGIMAPPPDPRITRHAYHLYTLRYDADAFGGHSRDEFLAAMGAEGIPVSSGYVPLYKEVVFARRSVGEGAWCRSGARMDYTKVQCPVCEQLCADGVWIFQTQLLGDATDMDDIAEAIQRIQAAWTQ